MAITNCTVRYFQNTIMYLLYKKEVKMDGEGKLNKFSCYWVGPLKIWNKMNIGYEPWNFISKPISLDNVYRSM